MPVIRIPARVPKTGGKAVKGIGKRPRKGPKQPAPQSRRDSSSSLSSPADLSGDDGYSALEDLSESDEDDDDEHLDEVETKHILIEHNRSSITSSPRPSSDFAVEDETAIDADDDRDSSDDDQNLFADSTMHNAGEYSGSDNDNGSSWNGFSSEPEAPYPDQHLPFAGVGEQPGTASSTPNERRVRFTGVPESESDSEETEEDHGDLFPDLFVEQTSLDPTFRREIEHSDPDDFSDSSYAFWDNNDESDDSSDNLPPAEKNPFVPPTHHWTGDADFDAAFGFGSPVPQSVVPDISPEKEDDESDGYESDGETTEEDEPVPIRRMAVAQTPKQPSASSNGQGRSDSSDTGANAGASTSKSASHLVYKRARPVMVVNPHTKKMMIFTPSKKRRWPWSDGNYCDESMSTDTAVPPVNPLSLAAREHLTLCQGLFGHWDFVQDINQVPTDPDQAVLPLFQRRPSSSGSSMADEDGYADAGESALNLEDFIHWDGLSDGEDNMDEGDDGNTDGMGTPSRRPSVTTTSDTQTPGFNPFLEHLTNNGNIVGAFRLNQNNQKLILNGEVTQESLAFGNTLFNGTLRGIKTGNLGGAATPLTPERRRKPKTRSPAELKASRKRKASSLLSAPPQFYKKQRSISDVGGMHI